jgi:hypothetical protein
MWYEASEIVAECFAAVTPNNNKLQGDVERLRNSSVV